MFTFIFIILCTASFKNDFQSSIKSFDENTKSELIVGQTVDVHTEGYFERLQNAFAGVLIGLALIVFVPCCLGWNEYRHVTRLRVLSHAGSNAVSIFDPNQPQQRSYPKNLFGSYLVKPYEPDQLVHFEGKLETNGHTITCSLVPQVQVNDCCRLVRKVEVYQLVERSETEEREEFGGSKTTITTYFVDAQWTTFTHDDPHNFNRQTGQQLSNYSKGWETLSSLTSYQLNERMVIPNAKVGKFMLPKELLSRAPTHGFSDSTTLTGLPEITIPGFHLQGNRYSTENGPTKIGDVRISYEKQLITPALVSVMAEDRLPLGTEKTPLNMAEEGKSELRMLRNHAVYAPGMIPCYTSDTPLGHFWAFEYGSSSIKQMIANARSDENMTAWFVRIICYVLLYIGFYLIFKPIATLLTVVPFFAAIARAGIGIIAFALSLACCLTTMSAAWFTVRPVLTLTLVALVWGGIYLTSVPDIDQH